MQSKVKKKNIGLLILIGIVVIGFIAYRILVFRYLTNNLSINMKLPGDLNSVVGRNLSLPDKYSKLLPLYPGSRIFSIIEGKDNGKDNVTIATRIKDDINKTLQWHEQEINNIGYTVDDTSTMNEVTNIWFHNDQYKGSITLSNKDYANPGKTTEEVRVSLWLEKE